MRYLTKSRFKLALECSTKLYYTGKKEYPDKKLDDPFLESLAKGGFQVGELAKCYFPDGQNIDELDHETALAKTSQLLAQEDAVIYEAAFNYGNLFIRADIVVKRGNILNVYEVKAKSINPSSESFLTSKGQVSSKWKPYIYDIAFQKYVIQNSHPGLRINAYLILADKSALASVEGLNQKFFLFKDEKGRIRVKPFGDVSVNGLGRELLVKMAVDDIVDQILTDETFQDNPTKSFKDWIHFYADKYQYDELIQSDLGSKCGKCEFKTNLEEENIRKRSGFKECWERVAKFSSDDFAKPSINEIWDFRKKDEYIASGKYFQADLSRLDLEPKNSKPSVKAGLSRIDRQELQITKSAKNDFIPYLDKDGIREIMRTWNFPLHFIDFETTAVAIPFNAGRRPYEQIAFQYSHHIANEDGTVEHKGQWINTAQGKFPNFDFVRELKRELENDNGTIFRYATHENSILNAIYRQLRESDETDKEILCSWIQTITQSTNDSTVEWVGNRNMVDLREIVLKYYYAPATNGSNSLKYVFPAILNSSTFLKDKYSQPIYGDTIKSFNFRNYIWVSYDEHGKVISPYEKLGPVFENIDQDILDNFVLDDDSDIQEGGSAMLAYAQMQFTDMSSDEKYLIVNALLRYCELDTLAMVMIWESWRN